ncbi:hypothetical protein ACFLQN_02475 [Candidatus Aenigmatarchaeota archaeon]
MRLFAISVLLFCLLFLVVVNAHEVSMNFAFNIGGDKDDTIIHVNDTDYPGIHPEGPIVFDDLEKKYISAERAGIDAVAALVFGGSNFLTLSMDTTYGLTSFLFKINQDDEDNRFIVAFTEGSWDNIENHLGERIPSKTYGDFNSLLYNTENFVYSIILQRSDIEFIERVRLSGLNKLFIKNVGEEQGKTKILVEVR